MATVMLEPYPIGKSAFAQEENLEKIHNQYIMLFVPEGYCMYYVPDPDKPVLQYVPYDKSQEAPPEKISSLTVSDIKRLLRLESRRYELLNKLVYGETRKKKDE